MAAVRTWSSYIFVFYFSGPPVAGGGAAVTYIPRVFCTRWTWCCSRRNRFANIWKYRAFKYFFGLNLHTRFHFNNFAMPSCPLWKTSLPSLPHCDDCYVCYLFRSDFGCVPVCNFIFVAVFGIKPVDVSVLQLLTQFAQNLILFSKLTVTFCLKPLIFLNSSINKLLLGLSWSNYYWMLVWYQTKTGISGYFRLYLKSLMYSLG